MENVNDIIGSAIAPHMERVAGYEEVATDPAVKNIRMICNDCGHNYTGHYSSICPNCNGHNTLDLESAQDLPNDYEAVRVQ